ncbi:MAG: hypothetical protein U0353_35065 [Sandaracinus sp.]
MISVALGVGLFALLGLVGAGPSVALLGGRWRSLWPFVAPIVGFALVAVLTDIPGWFVPASRFAWPLLALLVFVSLSLLWRRREALSRADLWAAALPLALLPWSLAHYLSGPTLTTLSEHNHDWMYYLSLEHTLGRMGYGGRWTDTAVLLDDLSAVLRRGGWRAGLSNVGAFVSGLSGLRPHEVDGVLWGVLHASFAGAAHAAHRMLVPVASCPARAFVIASAALSGPTLLLLRMSFASHLAAMPLVVLFTAAAWRGLTSRGRGLRVLAALLLGALVTVLADATPYVAVLGLALVLAAHTSSPIGGRTLLMRAAYALAGIAIVPCALVRIALSLHSLGVTGYHPPAARFDANLGALLPTALGAQAHELDWSQEPLWLGVIVALGCVLGCAQLLAAARLRAKTVRLALLAPLGTGAALALVCDLASLHYPAWKIALTTSPFVAIALGAALDRLPRPARASASAVLLAQAATLVAAWLRAPPPIGVLPAHEELVQRLASEPGEIFLLGHHGGPEGVAHEHALAYLFGEHGRDLRGVPHPASYLRVSWPSADFAVHDGTRALVITPDEDRVLGGGEVVLRTSTFVVLAPARATAAGSITFDQGFLPREIEPGRVFRWGDARASFFVDLPMRDSCLVADLRGTPDGDAAGLLATVRPLAPHVYAPEPTAELSSDVIPLSHDWARHVLARVRDETPRTVYVELSYLGRRRDPRVDARPIHFALGNLELARGDACPASR